MSRVRVQGRGYTVMYLPGPVDKVSSINSRSADPQLDHLTLMNQL